MIHSNNLFCNLPRLHFIPSMDHNCAPLPSLSYRPTKKSQRRKTGQRNKLPNKVMDFQVRIHILEGRQLVGSGINPVVKVICGKDIQETSIQKGTNSPSWDQVSVCVGGCVCSMLCGCMCSMLCGCMCSMLCGCMCSVLCGCMCVVYVTTTH